MYPSVRLRLGQWWHSPICREFTIHVDRGGNCEVSLPWGVPPARRPSREVSPPWGVPPVRRLPREVSLPWYVLSSSRYITSTTPQTPCSLLSVVMVSLASLVQLIYMSTMLLLLLLLLLLSLFTVRRMLSLTAIAVYHDSICVFFYNICYIYWFYLVIS